MSVAVQAVVRANGAERAFRFQDQHGRVLVIGLEFNPGRAHPEMWAYGNGLCLIMPPFVPVFRRFL